MKNRRTAWQFCVIGDRDTLFLKPNNSLALELQVAPAKRFAGP